MSAKRDLMAAAASAAARLNAMDRGCKFLPHGSRLFEVGEGWESTSVAADGKVVTADTLLSLETALRDPECKVIFIPHNALVTHLDIEKLCHRNAAVKTLFREVKSL
jgi:hypothetical protein